MGKPRRYGIFDRTNQEGRKLTKSYGQARQDKSITASFRGPPLQPPGPAIPPAFGTTSSATAGGTIITQVNGQFNSTDGLYEDINGEFFGAFYDNAINLDVTRLNSGITTTTYAHIDDTGTALAPMYSGSVTRTGVEIISAGTSNIQFIKVSLKRTNPGTALTGNVTVRLTDNSGTTIETASATLAVGSVATSFTDYTFDMGAPTAAPNGTRVSVEYSAAGDASNYIEVEAITETSDTGFGAFSYTSPTYTDVTTENVSMTFDSAPASNADFTHTVTAADFPPAGPIPGFTYSTYTCATSFQILNSDTVSRTVFGEVRINGELQGTGSNSSMVSTWYYTQYTCENDDAAKPENRSIQIGDVITYNIWTNSTKTTTDFTLNKVGLWIFPHHAKMVAQNIGAYYYADDVSTTNIYGPYLGTNLTPTVIGGSARVEDTNLNINSDTTTNVTFYFGTDRSPFVLRGSDLVALKSQDSIATTEITANYIKIPALIGLAIYNLSQ